MAFWRFPRSSLAPLWKRRRTVSARLRKDSLLCLSASVEMALNALASCCWAVLRSVSFSSVAVRSLSKVVCVWASWVRSCAISCRRWLISCSRSFSKALSSGILAALASAVARSLDSCWSCARLWLSSVWLDLSWSPAVRIWASLPWSRSINAACSAWAVRRPRSSASVVLDRNANQTSIAPLAKPVSRKTMGRKTDID